MKETIYTIPINEAFDTNCQCPLCLIEERLQNEQIEYTLGPAMMEPDFRIISNEKGFCKNHYGKLIENCKALPMALVLQTHIKEQNNQIFSKTQNNQKHGFFNQKSREKIDALLLSEKIEKLKQTCVICENIEKTMSRYIDNVIYIYKTAPEFRDKFASQNGFCLFHFKMLLDCAIKNMNKGEFEEFYNVLINMQQKTQNELYDDICAFVRLFDHNSDKKANKNVKNAIKRSVNMLCGLVADEND